MMAGPTALDSRLLPLALALAAAIVLAVGLGSTGMGPDRVIAALLGEGSKLETLIVWQLRLPRILMAAVAGALLAAAGFLLQRVTRNDLASPGALGVVDGAGLGVVLFLVVFTDTSNALTVPVAWQPLAAAIGGVTATAIVFLAAGPQARSAIRLILFGVATAAALKAIITLLMIVGPIYQASDAIRWMAGSVHAASWPDLALLTGLGVLPLAAVFAVARQIAVAELDDDTAGALGLPPALFRGLAVVLAAIATAIAVSFVGGVAFVGLMAPHLAGHLVSRRPLPAAIGSLLVGGMILVVADTLVRWLFAPVEVPAGTATAVIGAPYFVYLAVRKGSRGA